MGIPTINQIPPKEKLLPPNGVYITEVEIDHRLFHGITNVGKKPTVQDMGPVGVETHILDFQGDVYEKEAKVLFLAYIRPERKFDSLDELKAQIKMDTKCALDFFNSWIWFTFLYAYGILEHGANLSSVDGISDLGLIQAVNNYYGGINHDYKGTEDSYY